MTATILRVLREAIPGHLLDFLPVLFMRELMDEPTCTMLGIKRPGAVSKAAQSMFAAQIRGAAFTKRGARSLLIVTPAVWEWAAGYITRFLVNYRQPRGWQRSLFTIPEDLAAGWSVPRFT